MTVLLFSPSSSSSAFGLTASGERKREMCRRKEQEDYNRSLAAIFRLAVSLYECMRALITRLVIEHVLAVVHDLSESAPGWWPVGRARVKAEHRFSSLFVLRKTLSQSGSFPRGTSLKTAVEEFNVIYRYCNLPIRKCVSFCSLSAGIITKLGLMKS